MPNQSNGLRKESIIRTNKIATIDRHLAIGLLGKLNKDELFDLNTKLKFLLKLN